MRADRSKWPRTAHSILRDGLFQTAVCLLSLIALLHALGCSPPPDDTGRPVADPNEPAVRVIPDTGAGSLASSDGNALSFQSGGETFEAGDILVSTKDGGFLRKVDSVTINPDGTVTTVTAPATIAEAVKEGTFTFTDGPPNGKARATKEVVSIGFYENFGGTTLYNQTGITVSIPSGEVRLRTALDLDIVVEWFRLTYFAAAVKGDAHFDLDIRVTATGRKAFTTEVNLIPPRYDYFYGAIGLLPVVVEVTTTVVAGVKGSTTAAGEFETGLEADSNIAIGAQFDGANWGPISRQGFEFKQHPPTWCMSGTLTARAYVKPKISVQLYTVVGPTFDLEPYLQYEGDFHGCSDDPAPTYDWTLTAGVAAHASVRADILDTWVLDSGPLTLFDLGREIASGHMAPPPNTPPTASAGTDQTVTDADGNGSEQVTLNGSGSHDDDGTIVSHVWKEGTTQIATGATPQVTLAVGTHDITLTVTDDDGDSDSDTVTMNVRERGIVSTPIFDPDGGTFTDWVDVTISCATGGATIKYTTNGSTPSRTNGTTISSGSSVRLTNTTKLKAMAYKDGMSDSPVAEATFTKAGPVATPTFDPDGGTFTDPVDVTISCDTPGATIRYTTDGRTPTPSHGTVYTAPMHVTETTTIQAIAYKSGMTDSAVASAEFYVGNAWFYEYAGNYEGYFTGDEEGTFSVTISEWGAIDGTMMLDGDPVEFSGSVSKDGRISGISTGVTVTGQFNFDSLSASGTWEDPPDSGTWDMWHVP